MQYNEMRMCLSERTPVTVSIVPVEEGLDELAFMNKLRPRMHNPLTN